MHTPTTSGPATAADVAAFQELRDRLATAVSGAVRGKRGVVDLALVSIFAGGHLLLEDVPGTGKTTLARAVAAALGGDFGRVQFTPDLLPSDVTGTTIYDQGSGQIRFRSGPVFANVVLADEINRAAAKTQSALLEVMAERTVTVDGVSHPVPEPFVVIATQNPIDHDGTYRLPEAQLDRFLLSTSLGYPDAEHEIDVLRPGSVAGEISHVAAVTTPAEMRAMSAVLQRLHVADPLLRYVRDLGAATRADERLALGASTRALRSLVSCVQVYAAGHGRHYVIPSDVQRLVLPVFGHRVSLTREAMLAGHQVKQVLGDIIAAVPVPQPAAE